MSDSPRIVLIHALEESVIPSRKAFREQWPEALVFDLLDTSLAVDLAAVGRIDAAMIRRFVTLGDYAASAVGAGGVAAGILFTCSAFGPAIEAVKERLEIPVLRPNEAAFRAALAQGDRIGLIVSFGPSGAALSSELEAMAAVEGRRIAIEVAVADGALSALKASNGEEHDARVATAAARLRGCDVIVLGQFSLARSRAAVQAVGGVEVVTTPDAAVIALRELVVARRGE
ncbi:Asp/Glu/hydantoin racemase [Angulomicrobium tetraedrale]|uniref:Asp/Glu/hydantoin racemase n=1 Tax=Ancylobacter tetraedralis TaxID=217068 RepID=A0A839ZDR6_9HYPH|nr:aspartate/glutamate racemase family protein [Ancylobacter tetraedralis]MBB3772795.1 Asp/Glu/hydantoin racemase [Ancylobacter tetraedralis]